MASCSVRPCAGLRCILNLSKHAAHDRNVHRLRSHRAPRRPLRAESRTIGVVIEKPRPAPLDPSKASGEPRPSREEPYRLLTQDVLDYAIFMLDPNGFITSWNEGARQIKGWTAEEIIGQHFSRLYPQEAIDRGSPQHALRTAIALGHFEDAGWRMRKDGSRFWANAVITPMRDDASNLVGFSKITRDLTETRLRVEALRQSEERFRLLIEGVTDHAIFMLDPQGRVSSWNAGAMRIKGYRPEEILGRHFSIFYPEDAIKRGWPEHELAIARRDGRFEDEGWRLRKDGSRIWANVVISALHDDSGGLRGFAKVTRDLTERVRVEELEREGRHTSEFLAMLGHELRSPLAPIRNAAALLRERDTGDPLVERAREVIERQLAHMSRLVDDLLDVSRITSGKVVVNRAPLDLGALVATAAEAARPLLKAKAQHLHVALERPLMVNGDATRLTQVVVNLLSNASKYTPHGGQVWVELQADGHYAELRVRDDGMGISAGLLPRVFQIFIQGDRTLDRSEGGLGLGLTLVRKLLELHDGTVSASSAGPGHGSEFVVRLARLGDTVRPEPEAPAHPDAGVESRLGLLRVLVVDDNLDSTETLEMLLQAWGYDVRTAADGQTALTVALEFEPQVVLLDIGLPRMDGYEVARRLTASARTPFLVALTGYGQAEHRQRAFDAGFGEHLVKPVDPLRLRALLDGLRPKS